MVSYICRTHQTNIVFMSEGTLRQTNDNLWLFGIVLLLMLVVAVVKFSYSAQLSNRSNAVFYNGEFQRYFREQRLQNGRVGYLLSFNFLASLSLFGFAVTKELFNGELPKDEILFLLIFSGVLMYRLIRKFANAALKHLFNSDEGILEHEIQQNLNQQIIGLPLLPIVMLHLFVPEHLISLPWPLLLGCLLIAALVTYSFVRGIRFVLHAGVGMVYIILYLCTLEILPFIVLIRLFVNQTA